MIQYGRLSVIDKYDRETVMPACPLSGGKKTEKQKGKWISRVHDVTLGYPLFISGNQIFQRRSIKLSKYIYYRKCLYNLESLPRTPIEKQQQREQLETSGKHIEGEDQFGEVGEEPEVLGRAYKFQSRSDVV